MFLHVSASWIDWRRRVSPAAMAIKKTELEVVVYVLRIIQRI